MISTGDAPLDLHGFFEDLKRELEALWDRPPYVWVNTPPERVQAYRRMRVDFAGYTEDDIAAIEGECGFRLPAAFVGYLKTFGVRSGDLLIGSDLARRGQFAQFRAEATRLYGKSLPTGALVFLLHQGYSFDYFIAAANDDPPVRRFDAGQNADKLIARSFTHYLEKDITFKKRQALDQHFSGGAFAEIGPELEMWRASSGRAFPTHTFGAGAFIEHPLGAGGALNDWPPSGDPLKRHDDE
jgi:hypothetical protein